MIPNMREYARYWILMTADGLAPDYQSRTPETTIQACVRARDWCVWRGCFRYLMDDRSRLKEAMANRVEAAESLQSLYDLRDFPPGVNPLTRPYSWNLHGVTRKFTGGRALDNLRSKDRVTWHDLAGENGADRLDDAASVIWGFAQALEYITRQESYRIERGARRSMELATSAA